MSLTSIGLQKTPGRPTEVTFAADTGTPSDLQEVLLIGRKDASSGTISPYAVTEISNSGDLTAATEEANTKFGAGSELAKMVIAAVTANLAVGRSSLPALKAIPLASTDTDFGATDEALTAAATVKAEFIVSPFAGSDDTLRDKLRDTAALMSGAQRVHNNQFGTVGVVFERAEEDPSLLDEPDSQYLMCVYMRDTGAPDYSVGESAAAVAAVVAAGPVPFNPVNNLVVGGLDAPADQADWLTIGAGLESETALNQGWTPLKVLPNGDVAIVRSVTSRITSDGVTPVTSYYDVQDFQVLYYWRKTVFTRLNQPDLTNVKASLDTAKLVKSELIRLARLFEEQGMFQAVAELAKQFQVERSSSDRHRFDVKTPVNVIPGLHVIATNIEATTAFDTLSI